MPHVRSVSIGVWLTRGSRHEPSAHEGIAHFVEHMLFKGTATRSAEDIAQQDRLDRRPPRRVHVEGVRRLLHQGARRAPAAGHRRPVGSRDRARLRPGRDRAGEEGGARRDQDGGGHARRPGARALHRRLLAQPSARPADPRPAGNGVGARSADPASLLRRRLRRLELRRRRRRQSRARPRARPGGAGVSRRPGPRIRDPRRRTGRRRRGGRPLQGPRAEPRLLRHAGPVLRRQRPLRRRWPSTRCSAAR